MHSLREERYFFIARNFRKTAGFTLVELIAIIVILSVLASIGTGFVVRVTDSYQSTQSRALLVNTARLAIERMTRELRISLPYSARIVNSGNCIQFVPVMAGGFYLEPVPDTANGAPGSSGVAASPVIVTGTPGFITIGAMGAADIYGVATGSKATFSGFNNGRVTFSTKVWDRNSISRRFYLVSTSQAFCVIGTELRAYENIAINVDTFATGSTYTVLARNVTLADPFTLQSGAENRNSRVGISLNFSANKEIVKYTQGVNIRNVP